MKKLKKGEFHLGREEIKNWFSVCRGEVGEKMKKIVLNRIENREKTLTKALRIPNYIFDKIYEKYKNLDPTVLMKKINIGAFEILQCARRMLIFNLPFSQIIKEIWEGRGVEKISIEEAIITYTLLKKAISIAKPELVPEEFDFKSRALIGDSISYVI